MKKNGVYLPFRPRNGNDNMDLDERLLNFAIQNEWDVPVLRFYGWSWKGSSLRVRHSSR